MILVVGSTGMVGQEVCRRLRAKGNAVRGLVRPTSDPAAVGSLQQIGVETVQGDLRDASSLKAAVQGADAVITTASSMPLRYEPGANSPGLTDRAGYLSLIDAAQAAGVRRFVYTSFPPSPVTYPLEEAKRAVEDRLQRGEFIHTILRPTFFTELWFSPMVGFDAANRKAAIYGEGRNPISWISYRNVADFLVAALDCEQAYDTTLELGGPDALSPLDVVQVFERAGGQPFEVTHVPVEALRAQWEAAADEMQKSFSGLMLSYAEGKSVDMRETLRVMPVQLASVRDYAHQVLGVAG